MQKVSCDTNTRTVPVWADLDTGDLVHYQPSWSHKCYEYLVIERNTADDLVMAKLPRNGSTARSQRAVFSESRTLGRGYIHLGENLDTYFAKQTRTRKKP